MKSFSKRRRSPTTRLPTPTERRLASLHQQNELILRSAAEGILGLDLQGRHTFVNPAAARMLGYEAEALLRRPSHKLWHHTRPDGRPYREEECQICAAYRDGAVHRVADEVFWRKNGTSFPVEYASTPIYEQGRLAGAVVTFTDITERKRAEERIAQLSRVQAILADVDRAIIHIADRQKLLDEVCRIAVERGGFKLAWIGLVAPDRSVQPVAQAGAKGYLEGIRVTARDVPEGRGPVGTAIREDRTVVIQDIDRSPCMTPWRDRADRFGLRYVAAFPIRLAGKVAGAFQVYAPKAGFFDESELGLLTQVSGEISFALTAIADADARRKAEKALSRSERNLTDFFNHAPIGLEWLSASGSILRANQAQLDLLACRAEEYVGRFFGDFCVDPMAAREVLERLAANETVRNVRMQLRRKDGALRVVLVDAVPLWQAGQFLYSSVFSRDITDRVNLEEEILEISEQEQRRLARDLHDGLGQLLVGTAFLTSSLRQELAAKSLPESRQADRLLQLLDEAVGQTRGLARGAHPVRPEPNGLMVALEQLASKTKAVFKIRCRFTCRSPVLIEDNTTATHLYRIAQEAVTNAIKHGKPDFIVVGLSRTQQRIILEVKDNGRGLPARPPKKPGMGLRIMRYRAGTIGGSLAIQKRKGGGTTVVCSMQGPGPGKDPGRAPERKA